MHRQRKPFSFIRDVRALAVIASGWTYTHGHRRRSCGWARENARKALRAIGNRQDPDRVDRFRFYLLGAFLGASDQCSAECHLLALPARRWPLGLPPR